ncbi:DUF262 domain-containing protein [Rurimicrobium arvi]|uniref:GmrSD restriction endonucleases N-terminal domain-containing protein n=1 Tax=Rurimicrobium arvi TaxID=2049916 RepID=A0ABP8MXW7_9BACT
MKRQPTPQHITWFLDMNRNGQLDLDPPYQRKSVWTPKDRRFFLDTIFRNYPAPPIFVHREINDSGFAMYHVVDGKQRLETILSFADSKIAISSDFGDENLNGKKFRDLDTEHKRKFWDYVLVVDFIDSIVGTNIEEVFDRVNRNSKNLQPQELRHAKYDGWFITEAETESDTKFWWDLKVTTRAKEKRMRNIQFVSELLLIVIENKIVGFSQDYLDAMYAKYDTIDELEEEYQLDEGFDVESYIVKKEDIKQVLMEMNNFNQCVDAYGKTANNLYTLWALIAFNLDNLPTIEELAARYLTFMHVVDNFVNAKAPEDVEPNDNLAQFSYFRNSKGASTELPQRTARLRALETILQ